MDQDKGKYSERIGKVKFSILQQVALLFVLGVLVTGFFTYFSQYDAADESIKQRTASLADEIGNEVTMAVKEYPAYPWLIRYWYENSDSLDIEYDVRFTKATQTAGKCMQLLLRHPGFRLQYADEGDLEALPEKDQKLYAEIIYSWLITRVNEIKQSHGVDYLFCVVSDDPYSEQFFLFSAADPGSIRGTNYEEVYPIGVTVTVAESQQKAMRDARQNSRYLADAGDYVDYYELLDTVDGHAVLIGMTYNLSDIRASIESQTDRSTALAVAYQLFLSAICLVLILLTVLKPVQMIQQSIRKYEQSKDSEVVRQDLAQVRSTNEIGQLKNDIIVMTEEIDEHLHQIESITAERERVGAELAVASRIQSRSLPGVFPPFPDRSEFDVYATMTPAKEVGGDFYNFFMIDDDHLALMIADVSGKGIPASLFMMITMVLLKTETKAGVSPAEVLRQVNEQICSNNPEEMFVSVWMGILEISTGRLTAVNAGHEYPVVKHGNGKYELLKDVHGFVVGGFDDMTYDDYELQLEPGSRLFVYTDGLPEAMAAERSMFGMARIVETLNEGPDGTPKEVVEHMRDAVNRFVKDEEQFDDLTMLCLSYEGPAK